MGPIRRVKIRPTDQAAKATSPVAHSKNTPIAPINHPLQHARALQAKMESYVVSTLVSTPLFYLTYWSFSWRLNAPYQLSSLMPLLRT
jgi:hypothetical protein